MGPRDALVSDIRNNGDRFLSGSVVYIEVGIRAGSGSATCYPTTGHCAPMRIQASLVILYQPTTQSQIIGWTGGGEDLVLRRMHLRQGTSTRCSLPHSLARSTCSSGSCALMDRQTVNLGGLGLTLCKTLPSHRLWNPTRQFPKRRLRYWFL